MARHYHVVQNVPGYLPESDPDYASTLTEARQLAKERADRFREDDDIRYRVAGNMRDGYYVTDPTREHDLGVVININECSDSECSEDDS